MELQFKSIQSIAKLGWCLRPTISSRILGSVFLHTSSFAQTTKWRVCHAPKFTPGICLISSVRPNMLHVRHKSSKHKKQPQTSNKDDDDEEDDDDDEFFFEIPEPDKKMKLTSLRPETMCGQALGLNVRRYQDYFEEGCILVNGTVLKNKSYKMLEGDYLDVIVQDVSVRKVRRIEVIFARDYATGNPGNRFDVRAKVWQKPFRMLEGDYLDVIVQDGSVRKVRRIEVIFARDLSTGGAHSGDRHEVRIKVWQKPFRVESF